MIMYGIKNCDSVKKAQKFLTSQGINFEFVDLREHPINEKTLQNFVDVLGWDKLINKRSTAYQNLSFVQRQSITPALTLKNPTLIKRPVLVTNNNIEVGFNEKTYRNLFLKKSTK